MAKIICLANSLKHGDRCIAGIEISTGKWIRPVSDLEDGRVTRDIRLIDGKEPQLLDILEIPLADISPGHECENRLILAGKWQLAGRASVRDLIPYCESEILYNQWANPVPFSFLQKLPQAQRRTLQLIKVPRIDLRKYGDTGKWEATFAVKNSQVIKAKITDLEFTEQFNTCINYIQAAVDTAISLGKEYLMIISFSQPWQKNPGEELACWRLIAGVIELPEIDSILFEMKRIGWKKQDGVNFIQQKYNKITRQELTQTELREFLDYLKSI